MRKFNITVNGKTYEVIVDEVGGAPAASAPVASAPAVSAPAAAPAPVAAAPAAPAAPAPVAVPTEGTTISAPMPGTILKVNVEKGASVKKGDVLVVLEAMKMENDIQAPVDGTIIAVQTSKGASVDTGAPLVTIG
ncbi:MAG: biotin/lipoyl-binding protein [Clostridia bacterium]|nr:biotin/lipoyl-binding protein [Clostridia bacterium]